MSSARGARSRSESPRTEVKGGVHRMDNPRPEKVAIVDEIATKLTAAKAVFVTEYRGLTVGALATPAGCTARTPAPSTRCTRTAWPGSPPRRLASTGCRSCSSGPTALTFAGDDSVAAAKALRDVARTNPLLVLKGGALGTNVLDAGRRHRARRPAVAGGAARPLRRRACRPRWSRPPACSRRCPATSPTASRRSSTSSTSRRCAA